ncbi:MAG: FAD-binding oxidoreductase [Phyllobacterium sp.]|uniref:NAD(P)/FAD-dependent oxidoreductase n=1 Tax=Phyllobacterium sp. TaxID=1871046 RepID=UPI0030F0B9AF
MYPSAPIVSKVVVVGGGVFGVSAALHLARQGVRTVLVNDGPLASGASGRSLAWLNSARRRSADYHYLRLAGIDRYRTLAAKHPGAAWLRFHGGLTWDADDAKNEIATVFAHERSIGYDARLLSAEEIGSITPGVDVRSVPPQGAIFNPGEGWVDLPSLIDLLVNEFQTLGGEVVTDGGRAKLLARGGRAGGVVLENGSEIGADAVLLATGAAVPSMAMDIGKTIPDATPIALLVRTEVIDHPLEAVLNTPRVAIRPMPTGGFALDSAWSEEEVLTHADGTHHVNQATIHGLLEEASKVLAGNPKLAVASYSIGPKPIPGDGEPVFGPLKEMDGCYVAFSHSGATLGLIAGELLAGEIATGEANPLLYPFRPERF